MTCYCKSLLAVLVIILAWFESDFSKILLTIVGLILFVMSVKPGMCCCCMKKTTKITKKAKKR
jgi:hypothetical protein